MKTKNLPLEMNGFKIIKDLGYNSKYQKRFRICVAICKNCHNFFKVALTRLAKQVSCTYGCGVMMAAKKIKFINNIKVLKALSYNGNSRLFLVECPICKSPYTQLAKDFGTSPRNIRFVLARKTWKNI